MKYLRRMVCSVVIAGSIASCAVAGDPTRTAPVPTTPEALALQLNDLLKRLETVGESIVLVNGGSIACACVPTVQPNHPGPPPSPWNPAAIQRAIEALQALKRGYENNTDVVIQAANQQR